MKIREEDGAVFYTRFEIELGIIFTELYGAKVGHLHEQDWWKKIKWLEEISQESEWEEEQKR